MDDATFDEFVVAASARLGRTAALLTGDRHLAQDLLQTALAKTYLRRHRLASVAGAETYVRTVMAHQVLRWRRRRWTAEIATGELPEHTQQQDAYGAADDRALLRHALAKLPAHQRAVLVLRYFEDLTEEETAKILGCSLGTVKSRTSRALAALRGFDLTGLPPAVPCGEAS